MIEGEYPYHVDVQVRIGLPAQCILIEGEGIVFATILSHPENLTSQLERVRVFTSKGNGIRRTGEEHRDNSERRSAGVGSRTFGVGNGTSVYVGENEEFVIDFLRARDNFGLNTIRISSRRPIDRMTILPPNEQNLRRMLEEFYPSGQ